VVEHSVQHLVGARMRRRGRSPELGVGAAMDEAAPEKESGTGGGGELQPHGVERHERGGLAADGVRTGGGSPETAAPGRAWGRQGKREKGESGGTNEWAGLEGGAQLQREEGEDADPWARWVK
jgi:hypothetical protein